VDRGDELVAEVDDDLAPELGAGLGGLEDGLPAAADLKGGGREGGMRWWWLERRR